MVQYQSFGSEIDDSRILRVADLLSLCFDEALPSDFVQRLREKQRLQAVLAYEEELLVGCKVGYERTRGVFYSWLGGVHPEHRRRGIGRALMRYQHSACIAEGYGDVVTETTNSFRAMLLLNILEGFQIVGSYLNDRKELMLMLHKSLLQES